MRRILFAGAAVLVAAAAAIPLWLVLDDGGVRRLGAIDAANVGSAGQLTIPDVNGGVPLPIDSLTFRLTRPVGATQAKTEIAVVLPVGTGMPQLVGGTVQGTKAPTAKVELVKSIEGQLTAYLTFDLTNVTIDGVQDGWSVVAGSARGAEQITLGYEAMNMICIPSACAQPGHTAGTVPEVAMPELGTKAVKVEAASVPVPKGGKGVETFAPAKLTMGLNYFVPGLFGYARDGKGLAEPVALDLVRQLQDTVRKIATYKFGTATVTSLAIAAGSPSSDLPVVEVELAYRRLGVSAHKYTNVGTLDKPTTYCFSLDTKSTSCTGL